MDVAKSKYLILVGDGMADEPLEELDGKTPLEAAHTPHMDHLAAKGLLGLTETIGSHQDPGSDVANMAILGYDPLIIYQISTQEYRSIREELFLNESIDLIAMNKNIYLLINFADDSAEIHYDNNNYNILWTSDNVRLNISKIVFSPKTSVLFKKN